jgi:hypothetical protein
VRTSFKIWIRPSPDPIPAHVRLAERL